MEQKYVEYQLAFDEDGSFFFTEDDKKKYQIIS